LHDVYTMHVIPDELLFLWNFQLNTLKHVIIAGQNIVAVRFDMVLRFTNFIVTKLLTPDSHPTLTRFFTFRGCIDRMLSMHLLDIPKHVLVLEKTKPRELNRKRLQAVHSFFSHPEAGQELRRASMVLQLTGGVEAVTARVPKAGELPVLVSLAQGSAHKVVSERLQRLLSVMYKDPRLNVGPAASSLIGTAVDVILRFNMFLKYPFIICFICRRWFPGTYLQSIVALLHEDRDSLDVGVTLQLQRLAWEEGDEMSAIRWLASEAAQGFVEQLCEEGLCTSLPAERRLAEAKRWESSKVTHIATASRDFICKRFAKQRESKAREIEKAQKNCRRLKIVSKGSLAWQEDSIRPHGRPFGGASQADIPRRQQDRQAYIQENAEDLQLQRQQLIADAQQELDRLINACAVPITRVQWAAWLDENLDEFRSKMQTAPAARRERSHRLRARPDLPQPVPRIEPKVANKVPFTTQWAAHLDHRIGWHGLHIQPNDKLMFFVLHGWSDLLC